MDLQSTVAAALGGDKTALIALLRGRLGWSRKDVAPVGRGDAQATARARTAVAALVQGRKRAPLVPAVVGDHDEMTLAQLQRCLDHEDAVGGAICADGHRGYSQPVGGVVAYREHVSVSGVGYDIACFTGDTRIFTLDGQTPTLAEKVDQDVWVLACDPHGKPVPAKGICRKTRSDAALVRVTLDNGEAIRCTPDHLFMLRDGTYQRADALAPGQSLMPLYMTVDKDGYVLVRNNQTQRLMRLHYMVYRAGLTAPAPDLMGDRLVLHRNNFVRADNTPSNLVPMRRADHDAMHAAMRDKAHFNTPEFHKKRIAGIREFWIEARRDEAFMARRRQAATDNVLGYMRERPEHFREAIRDNGRRGATHLRGHNTDPGTVRRNRERAGTPTPCPLCGESMIATSSLYHHAQKSHPEALAAGTRKGRHRGKNGVAERLVLGANNHTVVSVESIPEREDVYCLSVPGPNNFALASGVFVHNCGNLAVETSVPFGAVRGRAGALLDAIWERVSFGVGRKNAARVDHPLFDDEAAWRAADAVGLKGMARGQLGTVGAGNHYVDLFHEARPGVPAEASPVWIGIHFGSRGLGHKLATQYLKRGGGRDGMDQPPTLLHQSSDLGRGYLAAMELAGRYAYAGREWVAGQVLDVLGGEEVSRVHNHHNYCVAGSQIVQTTLGPKRMDGIVPGERVYAFDGARGLVPAEVLDHWRSGAQPILRVATAGRDVRVSGEHPFLVVEDGGTSWKRADRLAVGDVLVCGEGYYETAGSGAWSGGMARLIGAFLGDGWVRQDTSASVYSVGLAIGGPGEAHVEDYRALLEARWPDVKWSENTPGAFGLTRTRRKVHEWFTALGVGRPSGSRRVPPEIFTLPVPLRLEFLAGYMDADGSVANAATGNRGRGVIAAANEALVREVREIAVSCGLRVTPVRLDDRLTNHGSCRVARCVIAAADRAKLPLWHRGKAAKQHPGARPHRSDAARAEGVLLPAGTFGQRVVEIEREAPEDVYDLTVDHPSHSFLAGGLVVHNCWREEVAGAPAWVIRKGCTPAFAGQRGFVGGSMGDDAVILEGVQGQATTALLHSTVHGAGRVFGRNQAKRTFTRAQMEAWLRERGVALRGGDVDESPMAYRRLPDVLARHAGTIRVLHTLRPFAVAMAGEGEVDPYKD